VVIALLSAAALISVGGCGSERAGATADSPPHSSSANVKDAASGDSAATPPPKLQPGAKTVALARAGDRPYDKTFDDIRFEIKPGEPFHRELLPDAIEALAGQRIRIRGFILPTPQKRGIRAFVLVRDTGVSRPRREASGDLPSGRRVGAVS
jgi:hypothetical protein